MFSFALALMLAAEPAPLTGLLAVEVGAGSARRQTIPDSVEVVALNAKKGLAAIKFVSHLNLEDGLEWADDDVPRASLNCHYPGMKYPTSGVTLVLWSLTEKKALASFVVYAVALKKDQCTKAQASTDALAAAKASFAKNGLDLAAPPRKLADAELRHETRTRYVGNEDGGADYEPDDPGEPSVNSERLTRPDGGLLHETQYEYGHNGAAFGRYRLLGAYAADPGLVLVELVSRGSMRSVTENAVTISESVQP